jgi:hypothetical protein
MNIAQTTGIMLILLPIAFNSLFILLQKYFEYPNILRKPADYVLHRFNEGGKNLIVIWFGFTFVAVLFVPLVVMMHQVLASYDFPYLGVATTIGVLAGVAQFLGLIRWPFLVPNLAKTY